MPEQFDAVVIGTGQGGVPLASALAGAGRKVAIIEREHVGGTCVNVGCTPTKTMAASARVAYLVRRAGDYGVETGTVRVHQSVIRKRKRDIVAAWTGGSQERLARQENLELIMGEGRLKGPRTVGVSLAGGGERELAADTILINTGARPRVPPITGLDTVPHFDSTSIMELDAVPEHLVVIGGGYVGLEFGQMFRRFGAAVTIIEKAPRCLPREDTDICAAMSEILREDDIRLFTGASASRVRQMGNAITVTAETGGDAVELTGSHLLVATGRVPNSEALDLASAGVEVDESGYIPVNDRLETSVPGIFAFGDVKGGPEFTHIAYDDYRVLRENLLEGGSRTTTGRLVPYIVYTDPQLGRIGLTEEEAKAGVANPGVARMPMAWVARAMETDESRGFMKAIVDLDTERVVGAAVLSIEGGEIMSMLQIAMMGDLPYTALRDGIFAHPALAESLNNLFQKVEPLRVPAS